MLRVARSLTPLYASAAIVLAASPALAESELGFPLGEKSRIHTNLAVGVAYDTNPGRVPVNETGDAKLNIRPGIDVDVPGSTFSFGLSGQLNIDQFLGVSGNASSSTQIGGNIGFGLNAGSSKSVFGFELTNALTRTPTFLGAVSLGPFSQTGSDLSLAEIRAPNWQNQGNAKVVLRPGGGALEFRLGYLNQMTFYTGDAAVTLADATRHGVDFEAKLRFLPKTAAVFQADLSFFRTFPADQNNGMPGIIQRSNPYNLWVGLQGQLTNRLNTVLKVGFGDSLTWQAGEGFFSSELSSQRTIIARAKFNYVFGEQREFSLGYTRTVQPVIQLRSFVADAFRGALTLGITERLLFRLAGEFQLRGFADDPASPEINRTANLLVGDVRLSYDFFEFLNSSLTYQVIRQDGTEDNVAQPSQILEDYTRHLVMLTVGFHY